MDALWNSYEALVSYTRQQSKDSENEWQQALGKALTWGKEQRQQVKTLSQEVVKKSSEVFFPEKSPLKPLAKQVEAIALTPLQFSFDRGKNRAGLGRGSKGLRKGSRRTVYYVVEVA